MLPAGDQRFTHQRFGSLIFLSPLGPLGERLGEGVYFTCVGNVPTNMPETEMALNLNAAIEDFWTARGRGDYFPARYENQLSLDEAYRIQLALIDRRVAAGERHIGWKVGLTAKAIQEQFGFHEPVFGCILKSFPSGHELPPDLIKPGFESELCMRFARPLAGEVTAQQVLDALEGIHPSFEIIETRGDLSRHIALALADNAQQHSVILGPAMRPGPATRLDQVTARATLNGKEVAAGTGDAVLGNPLNSVTWLARKLTEFGRGIRAGDIVMTGSFVRQFPLAPGDRAEADFSGIGGVTVRVAR
jgi:2-keto-4-pentenoate hydratase